MIPHHEFVPGQRIDHAMDVRTSRYRRATSRHRSHDSGSHTLDRGPRVSLSKWANERFPSFQELLTAHEVARLTRRHRWVLAALTLLGRFPRKQRFHGR